MLKKQGLAGLARTVRARLYVRWFEWYFGIHSETIIELKQLGLENDCYRPYVPTDYYSLLSVLDHLNIQPDRECFLDFGAGMGRVVILAATRPFRKVYGVELFPQLSEIARQNVRNALPRLKCRNIDIITADATQFVLPDEVTVVFFFNPFCGEVLAQVLENIRASLRRQPRPMRLVCQIPTESVFEREVRQQDWLVMERKMVFDVNSRCLFFNARA